MKRFIKIDFNLLNSKYPLSICTTCRLILCDHEKGTTLRALPQMPNYQDLNLPSEITSCNCYICITAKDFVREKKEKGQGYKRKINTKIDYGLNGASPTKRISIHKINKKKYNNSYLKMCPKCLQIIGKGKNHSCSRRGSKTKAMKNLKKVIVENLPCQNQEQLTSYKDLIL